MAVNPTPPMLSGLSRRLVQDGIVAEDTALQALIDSRSEPGGLVPFLVSRKLADPRQVAVAAATEFGIPLLDLDAMETDLEAFRAVDQQLIARHRVLPLLLRSKRLFLGMADPTNLQAIDEIKFQTGFRVDLVVVEQDKLEAVVGRSLESIDTSMGSLGEDDFDLESLEVSSGEDEIAEEVGRDEATDAPIVRFVNKVLLDAIKRGASDIHFEPYEKHYRVRTRLDGVLKQVAAPPLALSAKVVARLKVMARLDIAERRLPQDGRIKMRLSKNRAIDFRVNTCPTLFGEKVVLRILDPSSAKLGIDALGYEDAQKKAYLDALAKPYGMILVTGPTGSGKTVSLYTGLNILNTEDRNISTAEDPAEINMPGVNQVNVHPKVGLTFAAALRAFLRQDPDVVMVGEIRDAETARIAIQASLTGHLVLSTLHTNDAPSSITRMINIGVEPFLIGAALNAVLAQRLVRRVCPHCKVPDPLTADMREFLATQGLDAAQVSKGAGCDRCRQTGYGGRLGIYELLLLDDVTRDAIARNPSVTEFRRMCVERGMVTLRQDGLAKVVRGLTTIEEVLRVTEATI